MALMMEVEQAWLARTFVEYELLPRLLAFPGVGWSNRPPRSWLKFLSESECNLEHMMDEDMPAYDEIPNYLVKDAWHLVRQLQLVSETGLTPAGQDIANLQKFSWQVRDVASTYGVGMSDRSLSGQFTIGHQEGLDNLLAHQLSTCYRGQDDLDITGLLQRGAGLLADTEHVWAAYCPGLLLVEFEVLIHLACINSARAVQLCDDLLVNRDVAMHPYGMPSPDVPPMQNMVDHADAVAVFYLNDLQLVEDSGPGLSVSRATAMLFTFCGLLQEVYPVGPVQCLAPTNN